MPAYQPKDLSHALTGDDIDERGTKARLHASVHGLDEALNLTTSTSVAANTAMFRLYRAPYSGYLRNISVYIDTTDGSGHLEISAWDTGDAVAGSYTQTYVKSGQTVGASNTWQAVSDPAGAVYLSAGQHFALGVASDANVLKFGIRPALDNANVADLNTQLSLLTSGGNKFKLGATKASVYGSSTAIVEANWAVNAKLPVFTFQILQTTASAN